MLPAENEPTQQQQEQQQQQSASTPSESSQQQAAQGGAAGEKAEGGAEGDKAQHPSQESQQQKQEPSAAPSEAPQQPKQQERGGAGGGKPQQQQRRRGRRGGGRRGEDAETGGGGGGNRGGGGGGGRRDGYDTEPKRADELRKVLEAGDAQSLDKLAETYGQAWGNKPPWVKNRFATYQIRGIVGDVERLRHNASNFADDAEAQRTFRLLRPKVAYVARRYHDEDLYEFARVMRVAIDTVGADAERFRRFLDLFDSMLYYFRAAGGR